MTKTIRLTDNGLIEITGKDAMTFLQGQLTCDVRGMEVDQPRFGAICNNKGRVLANFGLRYNNSTEYFMQLPRVMIPLIIPVLNKYAKFSEVIIRDITHQWICYGLIDDDQKLSVKLSQTELPTTDVLNDWHLAKIRAGIATIFPATSDQFTPHELGYPDLGAISFDKGCYTGQEIIARIHYRGKVKQHLYRIQLRLDKLYTAGDILNNITATVINAAKIDDLTQEALVVAPDSAIDQNRDETRLDMDIRILHRYE